MSMTTDDCFIQVGVGIAYGYNIRRARAMYHVVLCCGRSGGKLEEISMCADRVAQDRRGRALARCLITCVS